MSARFIKIETCQTCPHRDHAGGFGDPAYVPTCKMKQGRRLPYTKSVNEFSGRVSAIPTYEIPDWCPLPVLEGGAQ